MEYLTLLFFTLLFPSSFEAVVDLPSLVGSLPSLEELVWSRAFFSVADVMLVLELNRLSFFSIDLTVGELSPLMFLHNLLQALVPITKPLRVCIEDGNDLFLKSHLAEAVMQRHAITLEALWVCRPGASQFQSEGSL
jgi:hypothetical protein